MFSRNGLYRWVVFQVEKIKCSKRYLCQKKNGLNWGIVSQERGLYRRGPLYSVCIGTEVKMILTSILVDNIYKKASNKVTKLGFWNFIIWPWLIRTFTCSYWPLCAGCSLWGHMKVTCPRFSAISRCTEWPLLLLSSSWSVYALRKSMIKPSTMSYSTNTYRPPPRGHYICNQIY